MTTISRTLIFFCLLFPLALAADPAPWGSAAVAKKDYPPTRVLYDLTSGDPRELAEYLDRAGYLFKLYGSDVFDSSIVFVVHGNAIPFFTIENLARYRELMERAQSLTVGTTIEFRMCQAAAGLMGLEPKDIHGFVEMVPMADAEIVQLQQQGYAYMR